MSSLLRELRELVVGCSLISFCWNSIFVNCLHQNSSMGVMLEAEHSKALDTDPKLPFTFCPGRYGLEFTSISPATPLRRRRARFARRRLWGADPMCQKKARDIMMTSWSCVRVKRCTFVFQQHAVEKYTQSTLLYLLPLTQTLQTPTQYGREAVWRRSLRAQYLQ